MQADATHEEHARHCHQSPSTNDSDPLDPPTRQEANAITPAGIRQIMNTKAGRWEGFEEGHKHRRGERGAARLCGWLLERRAAGLAAH